MSSGISSRGERHLDPAMTKTIPEIMAELGYTPEWISVGIVGEGSLRAQFAQYQESEDKHQEHYRSRAFRDFLDRSRALTTAEIHAIFRLTDDGPDGCDLTTGRIIELVISEVLSDEQLLALSSLPEVEKPPIQKRFRRACILRQLRREGLSDDVFRQVLESDDSPLHELILDRSDLRRVHAAWFAQSGRCRAIRNRAKELLRSRRLLPSEAGERSAERQGERRGARLA